MPSRRSSCLCLARLPSANTNGRLKCPRYIEPRRLAVPSQRVLVAVVDHARRFASGDAELVQHLRREGRHCRDGARAARQQGEGGAVGEAEATRVARRREKGVGVVQADDLAPVRDRPEVGEAEEAARRHRRQHQLLPGVAVPARASAHCDVGKARSRVAIGGQTDLESQPAREILVLIEPSVHLARRLAGVALHAGLRLGQEAAVDRPCRARPHSAASANVEASRRPSVRSIAPSIAPFRRRREDVAAEPARVAADLLGLERVFHRFEALDRSHEGVRGLAFEEGAGDALDDGVERAAGAEGDDGSPRGHRLERHDAEILFAGKSRARQF